MLVAIGTIPAPAVLQRTRLTAFATVKAHEQTPPPGPCLRGRGLGRQTAPERLTSVISAHCAALAAERDDRRDRAVSGLDAATPIALRAHGTACAPAWLPFVTLALIGCVLPRRTGTRSGSLLPASDDDAVPVPPPRSPSGSRRP